MSTNCSKLQEEEVEEIRTQIKVTNIVVVCFQVGLELIARLNNVTVFTISQCPFFFFFFLLIRCILSLSQAFFFFGCYLGLNIGPSLA